jgi:pre-rRNA-processing protein TSR3
MNPLASRVLLPADRILADRDGLVAVDCSWERAQDVFGARLLGTGRRLPALLASNPINYAKLHKLSSVEALAAALYILGFKTEAGRLLAPFKWGETFFTLNNEPLESYSKVETTEGMSQVEAQFF